MLLKKTGSNAAMAVANGFCFAAGATATFLYAATDARTWARHSSMYFFGYLVTESMTIEGSCALECRQTRADRELTSRSRRREPLQ